MDKPKPRPSVPRLRLKATGYLGKTSISGRMAIGPCEAVDVALVRLIADMAQVLYASAGAMRTIETKADEPDAVFEILTASAAIAATEAETLATLCSFDLCSPARIHARSLGYLARRFVLLPRHPVIARKMFDAGDASRLQLMKAAPEDHPARIAIEESFSGDRTTMEQLERSAYEGDDQSAALFMTSFEARYLSKWNHADIIALAEAGERILVGAVNVRDALVCESQADFMMYRAAKAILAILFTVKLMYGVTIQNRLEEFTQRLNAFEPRFEAESKAANAQGLAHLKVSRDENQV